MRSRFTMPKENREERLIARYRQSHEGKHTCTMQRGRIRLRSSHGCTFVAIIQIARVGSGASRRLSSLVTRELSLRLQSGKGLIDSFCHEESACFGSSRKLQFNLNFPGVLIKMLNWSLTFNFTCLSLLLRRNRVRTPSHNV